MPTILDDYLAGNLGNECPPQYHRWAFLSACAACLGRKVWVPFGHKTLYPTMYVVLVGLPASRKSTAIDIVEILLRQTNYDKFAFTKTSREKFLMDLSEGFEARTATGNMDFVKVLSADITQAEQCKEAFICADELLDFLGMRNYNFLSTLTTLWDNKDSYPERLKNSVSVNIPRPTINILGGFTPQNLAMAIPPEMIGQGATSRFVFVHATKPKHKITFPEDMPQHTKNKVVEFFQELQQMQGACTLEANAKVLIDKIYTAFIDLPDGRLVHYCSRRLIHLLKLCIILACGRGTKIITEEVVEEANTILAYTENSMSHALGEFGESRHARATQRIMEVLQSTDTPVTIHELWAAISQDVEKITVVSEILNNLINAKKIFTATDSRTNETVFLLNQELRKQNTIGIDFPKWIKELNV